MEMKLCYKIASDFGFNVDEETKIMQQHTPLGEDWNIDFNGCEDVDSFVKSLKSYLECIDDETAQYVDMRGTHGIPDSLSDLVEDGEWKKKTLQDIIKKIELNTWVEEFSEPIVDKETMKEKLKIIKDYANKIYDIWYNEIDNENRELIDSTYNTPVSEHVRWLLNDIEEVLEKDFN